VPAAFGESLREFGCRLNPSGLHVQAGLFEVHERKLRVSLGIFHHENA
jgi:hypothetical protein